MPELPPAAQDVFLKVATAFHQTLLKLSGGKVGGRIAGMPVLVLTTTGRKSGQKRSTPLTYFTDGDDVVIIASKGGAPKHPDWYFNLTADPSVQIARDNRTEPRTARTASPDEKARLWPIITATYKGYANYQDKTSRDIPVVILSPA